MRVGRVQYAFIGMLVGFIVGHGIGSGMLRSASERRALKQMIHEISVDEIKLLRAEVQRKAREHATLQRTHNDVVAAKLAADDAFKSALGQLSHLDGSEEEGGGEGSSSAGEDPGGVTQGPAPQRRQRLKARSADEEDSDGSGEGSVESESSGDASDASGSSDIDAAAGIDRVPERYDVNGFELPKLRAQNGRLIVIPCNLGYIEFALNLVCSLRRLRITNYVLLAMDKDVLRELRKRKLPVYADPDLPYITSKSAQWAEANFHKLVCTKLVPVTNLLKLGINVLLTDADIVWRHDPFPHVRDDLSLTYSIGSCHKSLKDNLDLSREKIAKLNTGFYFAHAEPSVIALFQRAYKICKAGSLTGDQPAINSAIHQDVASGNVPYTYGFFNGCLFANGCVYFKRLCGNTTAYDPVIVHANFVVGRRKKIRSLKKNGLWDLTCHPNPDEYALPDKPEK